jgi:glycogen debranching enzyme
LKTQGASTARTPAPTVAALPHFEERANATAEPCRPLNGRLAICRHHGLLLTDAEGRLQGKRVGFFYQQARFLARADLRIDGKRPAAASATVVADDHLAAYFVHAPLQARGARREGPRPFIELVIEFRVGEQCRLSCRVANRSLVAVDTTLSWRFDADFIDQSDLRAPRQRSFGPVSRQWTPPGTLALRCEHPRLRHATRLRFKGPSRFRSELGRIETRLSLAPQAEALIEIDIEPMFDPRYAAELPLRRPPPAEAWIDGCARLQASDPLVQAAWDRACDDLQRLQLGDGEGEEAFTPAAGSPNYIALFGRDALMAGWQASLLNPAVLRGSLSLIGKWTATALEPALDAQPGRVLHQRQLGPLALLGKTPFLRYYGDHSAAGLFLIGLARAYAQTGDREWFLANRDLALRILDWMDRYGDANGDGLFEYQTSATGGLKNQGWKDSNEAILHPDGRLAAAPIVVCEIQAIFFAARRALAEAFKAAGEFALGDALAAQAAAARKRFEAFWMEDEGFVALGLDSQRRQISSIASNGGECLAYGVLQPEPARRVAARLMQPDLFSGWGIRTLSARHPAYNPLGYHVGSVWPCFTALTARGLARYGLVKQAHTLARALFEATRLFDGHRLPELFGGHARDAAHPHPGLYPGACSPQAWSAGAVVLLVETFVGLRPAAPLGVALFEPCLPNWLPELTLRNVSLGAGRIDVGIRRGADGGCRCELLADSSGLRLIGPGLDESAPDAAVRAFVDAMP